jgi:hypothetical protein
VCKAILKGDFEMYFRNHSQWQTPPCMMRGEEPTAVSPSQMQPQMQQQMQPEEEMPEYQLENMYPSSYYIIYPEVIRQCDMYDQNYGSMALPSQEEVARMAESITNNSAAQVETAMNQQMRDGEMRQLGFAGRGLLRDLVGVLLLRELFGRRHRPHRPRRRRPYYNGY